MPALQTLGKYEIRRQLGRGAMGIVFEGWDPVIKRLVAIKTVRLPDPPTDETADEIIRFRREAEAAGRLNHPNIVSVFDYGETDTLAYIVMEFVDGPTVKLLLDAKELFPLPRILQLMGDLLAGLQFSHEHGVVHRDIKPANLMLTSAGRAKITDFGIARLETSNITQAGAVLGTPAYMAPEQFLGQTVDARADIYSSGVLLYQLLTGERPFDGGMSSIMQKALNLEAPAPSTISVTAPRRFDDLVRRAMAKRPEDRFASAIEFAAAIREAAAAPPSPPAAELHNPADEATIVAGSPPSLGVRRIGSAPAAASISRPPVATIERSPRARAGSASPLIRPGLIGVSLAGLAVLGGVGFFLLSGDRSEPVRSYEPARQPGAATSSDTRPPSAAAVAPVADPGQAVGLSSGASNPAANQPASIPAPAEPLPQQPPTAIPGTALPGPETATITPPGPTAAPAPVVPAPLASVAGVPVPVVPAPVAPSPLEQARLAARSVPCSALAVTSAPNGLHVAGFARAGAELDELRNQARDMGHLVENITAVEDFACRPIAVVAASVRTTWESNPRSFAVRPDRQEPLSGTRFRIDADTKLPVLYVDLYQSNGTVRHVVRTVPAATNHPGMASVTAPAPGPALLVAIGTTAPLPLGTRPESEPTEEYLAVLRPRLDNAVPPVAADLAVITVLPAEPLTQQPRPAEPSVTKPRPRPIEPAAAKAPPPRPPVLRSSRCSNIVSRAQLGETLSDAELAALRTECRS
jgi:serine/threonine-protein kinase